MTVLSDVDIHTPGGVHSGLTIRPFDRANVQPNSYDLRLGEKLLRLPYGVTLDPERDQAGLWQEVPLRDDGRWMLGQGTLYLGATVEHLSIPSGIVGFLHGVSTLGRMGLLVHITAGLIDSGYAGHPTLELFSLAGPIYLRPGQRIAQLTLHMLHQPAGRLYQGRYQHDTLPTPSRAHLDAGAPQPEEVPA